ncbi:hypothetical protein Tco_0060959 [Tanacetum coccineum]
MIANPDKPTEQILEPLSKMTEGNKKQYTADVRVMNYLLQAIPNDIYNSVDACKNDKDINVPNTKDTIKFKLDTQEITYTVDMFHDTIKLPVETPDNPFAIPATIGIIESFMHMVGYQGVVDKTKTNILQLFHAVINRTNVDYAALLWWDFINCVSQKKDVIQYPRFTKLIIAELMKQFLSISPRLEEDYH